MLTISVKQFVEALAVAPAYKPPELNAGSQYIQEKIADRLISGNKVRLSEINFESFDLEDINALQKFNDHIEQYENRCMQVAQSFRKLKPVVVSGTFV